MELFLTAYANSILAAVYWTADRPLAGLAFWFLGVIAFGLYVFG